MLLSIVLNAEDRSSSVNKDTCPLSRPDIIDIIGYHLQFLISNESVQW